MLKSADDKIAGNKLSSWQILFRIDGQKKIDMWREAHPAPFCWRFAPLKTGIACGDSTTVQAQSMSISVF